MFVCNKKPVQNRQKEIFQSTNKEIVYSPSRLESLLVIPANAGSQDQEPWCGLLEAGACPGHRSGVHRHDGSMVLPYREFVKEVPYILDSSDVITKYNPSVLR
jgi:hypothetical protein